MKRRSFLKGLASVLGISAVVPLAFAGEGPAATNLLIYSEDFIAAAWTRCVVTVSADVEDWDDPETPVVMQAADGTLYWDDIEKRRRYLVKKGMAVNV